VHGPVEKLDLQELEGVYSDEGHPAYHPALLLKVWLYAYTLGMTSSRRLEQRIRKDLAFRYLAGGAQPDFWALNEFRKTARASDARHLRAGGGVGAFAGAGKAGARSHPRHAHCRERVDQLHG
jgi:transposase